MITVYLDQRGVVMMDFLVKGATINGAYYASLLKKLRNSIKIERRGMLTRLLQANAPVHNSHVAKTEARSCDYEICSHPPYCPDLGPSDFSTMKSFKGKGKAVLYGGIKRTWEIFYLLRA